MKSRVSEAKVLFLCKNTNFKLGGDMMARPRKVMELSKGKISKEERENRMKQEKQNRLEREQLAAPDWLSQFAQLEFNRVVDEAGKIDLLDNLDLGILAIYANAYSSYRDITEQIKETGYLGQRETRYDSYHVVHPLLKAQELYVKQIMQCSSKLGLATTDRLKLIVPVKEEDSVNKFLKYVNHG